MKAPPVEIEEIDHLTVKETIHEVADGTAENQSQRDSQQLFGLWQAEKDHDQENDRKQGEQEQKREAQHRLAAGHHAKGRTLIADIREAEKIFDHGDRSIQRQTSVNDDLGYLVEGDSADQKQCD